VYACLRCGRIFTKEEMEEFFRREYKCPYCGYRILRKVRREVPKRVKAI